MAREAKTIITAEDKTKPGVTSAIGNILGLDEATKKLGKTIATAFTVGAIAGGLKKIVDFGADSYKAFAEAERAVVSFNNALKSRTDISRSSLESFNSSFSKSFGVDGEAILGMQTMLLASGRTQGQIEKLMNAAQGLSAATGKDLKTSVEELNKSFSGTEGRLGALIPELKDLSDEQLKAGDGVDVILEKFGHLNESISELSDTKLKNLTNAWDDFKEAIGSWVAPVVNPFLDFVTDIIGGWRDAIEAHNNYNDAIKKGIKERTLEDQKVILQKQIADRESAARVIALNFVGTDTRRDAGSMYAKQIARLPETKEAEALTKQLQAVEAEIIALNTAMVTAGLEEKKKTEEAKKNTGAAESTDNSQYDIQSAMQAAIKAGQFNVVAAMQSYMSLQPDQPGITGVGGIGRGSYQDRDMTPMGDGDIGMSGIGGFGDIISSLAGGLSPLIEMFGGMFTSLSSVVQIMNPLQTILGAMFEVIAPLIDTLLTPLVGILRIVGQALGAILVPILKQLEPIIRFITTAFVWLYNYAIVPLANVFIWMQVMVQNMIASLFNSIRAFARKVGIDLGDKMDKVDYSDSKLTTINLEDVTAAEAATVSGQSGGSGASYTGSQSVTFNFYNQGNVVGSGGLEELATLIDSIIKRNARYA